MNYPPLLMKRKTAAAYCDMAEAAFERAVAIGDLPNPVLIGSKSYWYRVAIDKAVAVLAGDIAGAIGGVTGTWREHNPLYKDHPDSKYRE